jgi:hypothetical protein
MVATVIQSLWERVSGREERKQSRGGVARTMGKVIGSFYSIGSGERRAATSGEWSIEADGIRNGKREGKVTRWEPFLGGERKR